MEIKVISKSKHELPAYSSNPSEGMFVRAKHEEAESINPEILEGNSYERTEIYFTFYIAGIILFVL
jgi:hypothetical protein